MDKYEEALERAKEWEREHPNGYVIRDMMEYIFPGYNDSEDERIRQTLIDMVKRETGFTGFPSQGQVLAYLEKQKEQKPIARENDFVSNPKTSVEVLRHYLVWAGSSEEEDCPYTWKTLADAIRDGINALEKQKQPEVDSLIRSELPDMEDNKSLGLCYCNQFGNNRITSKDVREIARHFYELGLNARNEK